MFRFGILSTAKIGVDHLIPAMLAADNCVVSAIASRDAKKARKVAKRFGVPLSFGSYEELLASDEVDGVYIPLPTSQHIDWTEKAVQAGKHVLCEKPISLEAKEIKPLIKARDKAEVLVSEAFMVTYHPQWLKVRELLKKGAVGQLRQVQASFAYHNVDANNMRNQVKLGGGALPDIGVYPIVATRFATGAEPQKVLSTVEFDPKFKTDRFASAQVKFKTFDLNFYISTQMALRQSIVFHGDKGFIELNAPFNSNLYEGSEVRLHNADHSDDKVFRFTGINQYQYEVEAFARAAAGRKQEIFSLEDSIANQRVIDAIYKAGQSGEWATV